MNNSTNVVTLTPETMVRDGRYNWKNQPDRLIYIGKKGHWHQFKKIGDPREVWCEVLDEDLPMLEETADDPRAAAVRESFGNVTFGG